MLMIRFQRIGRTNDPAFRVVVLERERAAKTGRVLEQLGSYNPRSKAFGVKEDRLAHWLSVGAQPTASLHNLLVTKGLRVGKKINVLPKKHPPKKEDASVADAPVSASAAAPAPAAPEVEAEPADTPAA